MKQANRAETTIIVLVVVAMVAVTAALSVPCWDAPKSDNSGGRRLVCETGAVASTASSPSADGTNAHRDGTTRESATKPEPLNGTQRPHLPPYFEIPIAGHRVIDGDTVEVTVAITVPVRLANIDAPELRDERQRTAATVARDAVAEWFKVAGEGGHSIRLQVYRLGMYGRLEGDLLDDGGRTLAGALLQSGVVETTDGDKRHEWTDAELQRIEGLAR